MSYQDLSGHLFSQRISLVHCLPPWLAPYRSFLFTALGSRPVDGGKFAKRKLDLPPKKDASIFRGALLVKAVFKVEGGIEKFYISLCISVI